MQSAKFTLFDILLRRKVYSCALRGSKLSGRFVHEFLQFEYTVRYLEWEQSYHPKSFFAVYKLYLIKVNELTFEATATRDHIE
jgi:phage-related protein